MSRLPQIFVCTNLRLSGASCAGGGAHDVLKALRAHPAVTEGRVEVRESVCMGYCGQGPNAKIMGGALCHGLMPEDAERLVQDAQAAHDADG